MNSVLRRSERVALSGLFVLGVTHATSAQQPAARPLNAAAGIAFVNVNLIRMDRERVEPGQTVIVRGDRIAVIGASTAMPVPPDAMVIQGAGRYLVPGLTDAHVHITTDMPWAPARP